MVTEENEKNSKIYECKGCDFKCSKKNNYTIHLTTRKHIKFIKGDVVCDKSDSKKCLLICNKCNKKYISRNGLWKHNKICNYKEVSNDIINNEIDDTNENKNNVIEILINENKDFKNIILDMVKNNTELQKQMIELCKNSHTINNRKYE